MGFSFFLSGNHETLSPIYQYNPNTHKFNLSQTIKTHGAIDLKHFVINDGSMNEHYLIVANSLDSDEDSSSNVVFYHFNQGKFTPSQILHFDTEVKQSLPVVVWLHLAML